MREGVFRHQRGAARQSAAAGPRALALAPRPAGVPRQNAMPGGAPAAAVGAARRLPCAARLGVARRNSLRALRALRSDSTPRVRGTKRASRADPETALLGAAEVAPSGMAFCRGAPAGRGANASALGPAAADCRSATLVTFHVRPEIRRRATAKDVRVVRTCSALIRSSKNSAEGRRMARKAGGDRPAVPAACRSNAHAMLRSRGFSSARTK